MVCIEKTHFILNVRGRALTAYALLPEKPRACALLLQPLAEERKGALPVLSHLMRALALSRIASLTFDFSGTGDSEGEFPQTDPNQYDAECVAALGWLLESLPDPPYFVVGVRSSSALATRLAHGTERISAVVLWAPLSGPELWAQLMQRYMVNDMAAFGRARESRAELETRLSTNRSIDLDGYVFTPAMYAWLQNLHPLAPAQPTLAIAGGHGGPTYRRLSDNASMTTANLRFPPFWNSVGHLDLTELIRTTTAWIEKLPLALPDAKRPQNTPNSETARMRLQLIRHPNGKTLAAIWDKPTTTPVAGALFLHGWSGDRTGPHRLHTRFARELSSAGVLCLRPDFFGRGFSDGASHEASIEQMTADAQLALEALKKALPRNTPVVVVAICSGCKVAISLAADNPWISRLLLWSAESMGSLRSATTGWRKAKHALRTYARKAVRWETWKKLLRGRVRADLVAKALTNPERRSAREARREDRTLVLFREFRNPILFVFGGGDPDASGSMRAYDNYCRRHGIPHHIRVIPRAGHSFYKEEWTQELLAASLPFARPSHD